MSDETEPKRQSSFDDEVDGLDCFASEAVDVADSADDVGWLFEANQTLPAMQQAALPQVLSLEPEWQRGIRDRWVGRSLVIMLLLVVGMLSVWLIESSTQQETIVGATAAPASTPAAPFRTPAAASSTPAAPPVAPAVPVPPVARVIKPPSPTTTRAAAARSVVPQTVAPRRALTLIASSPPAPSVETPARAIAPLVEEPAVIVATPETVRAEPAAAAPAAPPVAAIVPTDRTSIEQVLQAYRDAYDRLDAPAAAVIWPRVDTRALNRAFNSLAEQEVSFERCDLDIAGRKANARCTGEIRYVRRVGDQNPQVRRLSWSFAFERVSDRWQIAQVTAD